MILSSSLILIKLFLLIGLSHGRNPGPEIFATKGAPWPKPQQFNISTVNYFILSAKNFKFNLLGTTTHCNLLQSAFDRYYKIIQMDLGMISMKNAQHRQQQIPKKLKKSLGILEQLDVNLTSEKCLGNDDEYPSLNMDESYKLWITPERTELQAASPWGILRGLETFSQLIYLGADLITLRLNESVIKDFPRYHHRGLLIDTSRHFLPIETIYKNLDAMMYNKFNVLHWHIVDDPSFPYVSEKFPELSAQGAYNRFTKIYTQKDVANIIEYARVRGIRVLPEFDTPGHVSSWGVSHPELLTPCHTLNIFGPMDPSRNSTFQFLQELFTELRDKFRDEYFHLGGDEVDFKCWQMNSNITEFMKEQNITTYENLESYFIHKVLTIVQELKFKSLVWEEVFVNGVNLPNETVVHVWRGSWTDTMKNVTSAGKYAILSSCWYLDYVNSGGDWENFYKCEPTDFNGTPQEQELVLGGEACMWGEVVNEFNIIPRIWPRASAVAEKLWSKFDDTTQADIAEPAQRLEEHVCRMNRRKIAAQPPNGPSFCN